MRRRMTKQLRVKAGKSGALLRAAAAIAVMGSSSSMCAVSAFTGTTSIRSPLHARSLAPAYNKLHMSSIERDDAPTTECEGHSSGDESKDVAPKTTANEIVSGLQKGSGGPGGGKKQAKRFNLKDMLPPAPEDQLAMSGDIIALFVYAFLDHVLNDMMATALVSSDSATAAAIDPEAAATLALSTSIPVWYDVTQHTLPVSGAPVLPALGYVPYSPAISTAGTSAVILVSAWLLSGYFNGAFLYKNTLECSVSKAIAVAGRTWISATVITVGVALASDAWCDCVTNPSLGGLTKADADFLFGSLSVLAMWRFVLSSILGSGGSDD